MTKYRTVNGVRRPRQGSTRVPPPPAKGSPSMGTGRADVSDCWPGTDTLVRTLKAKAAARRNIEVSESWEY